MSARAWTARFVDHGTDDPAQHRVRTVLGAYLALTKPRVAELLLVATIPVMLQAHRGTVDIGLIAATLIGGWLGAASANTLNMVADADIDQKMRRTQRRPLARHAVTRAPRWCSASCSASPRSSSWFFTNLLAAVLVMITIAFLRRRLR